MQFTGRMNPLHFGCFIQTLQGASQSTAFPKTKKLNNTFRNTWISRLIMSHFKEFQKVVLWGMLSCCWLVVVVVAAAVLVFVVLVLVLVLFFVFV